MPFWPRKKLGLHSFYETNVILNLENSDQIDTE